MPRRSMLGFLLAGALLSLPTAALASNQGGGGALIFLALLYLGPLVFGGLALVLSLVLTFKAVRSPATRGVKVMAIANLVLGLHLVLLAVGAPLLLGGNTPGEIGRWALLFPAVAVSAFILALCHLTGGGLSGRAWLVLRLVAWGLPLLVPLGLGISKATERAAVQQRDLNLEQRLFGHFLGTRALTFVHHAGGEQLLALGGGSMNKGELQRWVRRGGTWAKDSAATFQLPGPIDAAAVDPAHGQALVQTYRAIWQVDLGAPDKSRQLPDSAETFSSVAISRDGRLGAAGGNGLIWVWSLDSGQRLHQHKPLDKRIDSLVFGADGQTIIVGGWERKILVLELESGKILCTLEGPGANGPMLFLSADGKTLLSGAREPGIWRWDLRRCAAAGMFARVPSPVTAFALTPDGRQLVVGDRRSEVHLLPFPGGGDERVYVGRVSSRENLHQLEWVTSFAFHPRAPLLAAGANVNHSSIAIFRLPRGRWRTPRRSRRPPRYA